MSRNERARGGEVPVLDVVGFLLARDSELGDDADVSPMKLQKLLYLAQGNYLAATGRRLFDEDVLAYDHGPVIYAPYAQYRGLATPIVRSQVHRTGCELPANIEEFMQRVWDTWSGRSAGALRELTHRQMPWRKNYRPGVRHVQIPDSDMIAYFGSEAPLEQRVFPRTADVAPAGSEPAASQVRGMFARPRGERLQLPVRTRVDRSARAAELRSARAE
ncbi:Panacea domain-containing protein [Cellulomonas sp. 179-A 4D5 NHS]|uniref:Panacea domain-containing protein n=1 Tax=Cellulomonas sp. 179-A 4D5 NHS TaxID=3142378 RepID=UPI0039A272EF